MKKIVLFFAVFYLLTVFIHSPGVMAADEIIIGYTSDALTMDPANHRERTTETILRNMYDGLVVRNSRMEVVPQIAESWQQLDTLTYDFILRKGVKFHNGDPLTVEDVKFTFDRIIQEGMIDGQTSPRKSLLGPLKEVKIIGPDKIRFILEKPWPVFPAFLPWQEVVSEKFVKQIGSGGMATQVNGTGPFKLVEWMRGTRIVMERFEDYYGGSSDIHPVGKARVTCLIWRIIPENASRVAALLSGEVDIINDVPAHSIRQIERNPDTRIMTVNGTRSYFLALNNTRPPFNNVKVRKALSHAVNVDLIIDKILNGNATRLNGILSPDAFGHNPNLPAYDYDPSKAKALLVEAGYNKGITVTLDVSSDLKDIAQAIAANLADAGIDAKVTVWEMSVISQDWKKPVKTRDMFLTSWGNGSLDPVGIMTPVLRTGGRGNFSGYSNQKVDALIDNAMVEIDRQKRASYYQEAESIINADAPMVFLWLPKEIYGVSARLGGWEPKADSQINLHDAYIKQ
ncbi:MAG: ABC transporter substrate-binding protein [Deltaproteobacteria bacterium]|nr:ABC transporter substrate-binding protein [Deltaproteobacteria bacterium]